VRQTKIVATVGPSTSAPDILEQLVAAGVDVFRLNFAHGTHASHAAAVGEVRAAAARAGRTVGVLQDLSGPKIRTGALEDGRPVELTPGATLRIAAGDFAGTRDRVSTTFAPLITSVKVGDPLLLDDGRLQLRVVETRPDEIVTEVVDGGMLGEHKGINAPGIALPAATLTDKDQADLRFGLSIGVDIVALSFVQSGAVLRQARAIATELGQPDLPLCAKLERPEAIDRLEEIYDACDAVMVARGDLGLEVPLERVPRIQKEVTRSARARGLPVIVATQVLESMRTDPRPTRAEVSDAANAVDDGVDAIMLAGETASGAYPVRAVQTLDTIIREAELVPALRNTQALTVAHVPGHADALCEAAVTLATRGPAEAIVAVTRGGKTARLLAARRPAVPIYAATDRAEVARRLALTWGVIPLLVELGDVRTTGARIGEALRSRDAVAPGSSVVLVSVSPDLSAPDANFLKLYRLG